MKSWTFVLAALLLVYLSGPQCVEAWSQDQYQYRGPPGQYQAQAAPRQGQPQAAHYRPGPNQRMPPTQVVFCPKFNADNTIVTCFDSQNNIKPCTGYSLVGEKVRLDCKMYYMPDQQVDVNTFTCEPTGVWSHSMFKCIPSDPTMMGYIRSLHSGYFKFFHEPKTGFDADKKCRKHGGHLIVLDTPEKINFVRDVVQYVPRGQGGPVATYEGGVFKTINVDGVYVGVNDMVQDGMMATPDGHPAEGWCPSSPVNSPGIPDCGVFRADANCITTIPCYNKRSFVCEINRDEL